MAKKTYTKYICDRCGVEMDAPVRGAERGPTAFSMSASSDVGVAGGPLFKWDELCSLCNSFVGDLASRLVKEARSLKADQ